MVKSIALLLPVYVTFMWALVFFFQKKTSGMANKVLALFMLTATLLYCSHAIFFQQFYNLYSFIDSIYILVQLSLYPFFYAYILLLSGQKINVYRYSLNFIPAVFLATVSLALNVVLTPNERVIYVKEILVSSNLQGLNVTTLTGIKGIISILSRLIFILHAIIYLLLGINTANKHNRLISDFYSNTEGRKMNWVRNISLITLFVSLFGIALAIIGRGYFSRHELSLLIPSVIFSTIYFLIGFNANEQLMISEEFTNSESETFSSNGESQFHESKLKTRLLTLFEKDKIYINADLRITTVSEALQTNRTYISRLINEEFGMNFNEFVNKYRIRESEKLLSCEDHNVYTLEYIAEKSGFGNANSFTRAFKELKGLTPGQYRLNCQKQLQVRSN